MARSAASLHCPQRWTKPLRHNVGGWCAENDALAAELKQVRQTAIAEIDRISKQAEREIDGWQTERNCARMDQEAAEARLAEAVELIKDMAEAITAEVNEKGGGGSILARLSDARRFLVGGSL
jgi:hypothetical protein